MPNGNNKRNRHSGPKPPRIVRPGFFDPSKTMQPPVDNGTVDTPDGKQLTQLGLIRLLVRFIESAGGAITITAKDIETMPTTHIRFRHHKELDVFDIGVHRDGQPNPLDTPPEVADELDDGTGD